MANERIDTDYSQAFERAVRAHFDELLTELMTLRQLRRYFRCGKNTIRLVIEQIDGVVKIGGLYRVPICKMPPSYHLEKGLSRPA